MQLVHKSKRLILKWFVSGIQTNMPTLVQKKKWSQTKKHETSTRHGPFYQIKTKDKNSIRANGTMDKAAEEATGIVFLIVSFRVYFYYSGRYI